MLPDVAGVSRGEVVAELVGADDPERVKAKGKPFASFSGS